MTAHPTRVLCTATDVAECLTIEAHTATRDLDGADLRLTLGYFTPEAAHGEAEAGRRDAARLLGAAAQRIETDARYAVLVSEALARNYSDEPRERRDREALPARDESLPDNVLIFPRAG